MFEFIRRLEKDDTPRLVKEASGALRAIDALSSHIAVPKAIQYGLIGAGAGGLGGFVGGEEGSRLRSAAIGAGLGGALGAGGGYFGGRRRIADVLQEISPALRSKVDDFGSASFGNLRREATQLSAADQKALREAASSHIKANPTSAMPGIEEAFSGPGLVIAGGGGAAGLGAASYAKKDNPYGQYGPPGGFRYGPPPPPMPYY